MRPFVPAFTISEDAVVSAALERLKQIMSKPVANIRQESQTHQVRPAKAQGAADPCGTGSAHARNRLVEPTPRHRG